MSHGVSNLTPTQAGGPLHKIAQPVIGKFASTPDLRFAENPRHVVRFESLVDVGRSRELAAFHSQAEPRPQQLQGAVDRGRTLAGNQFAPCAALAGEPSLDVLVDLLRSHRRGEQIAKIILHVLEVRAVLGTPLSPESEIALERVTQIGNDDLRQLNSANTGP